MNEYERLSLMYRQEYLLKKENIKFAADWRKWQIARKLIETAAGSLPENETKLLAALKLSVKALTRMQCIDDNPPLKKIHLEQMDGEPAWVVSYNHDGRWGIVDASDQSVVFFSGEDCFKEHWFDGTYTFKYKKEIVDHTQELEKYGIRDEVNL